MYIGRKKTNFSRQSRAKKNKEKAKTKVLGLDSLNLLHTHTLMSTAKSGTKDEGFIQSSSVFVGVTTSVSCSFLQLWFLPSDSASIYVWEIKNVNILNINSWSFFEIFLKAKMPFVPDFSLKRIFFFFIRLAPREHDEVEWHQYDLSVLVLLQTYHPESVHILPRIWAPSPAASSGCVDF